MSRTRGCFRSARLADAILAGIGVALWSDSAPRLSPVRRHRRGGGGRGGTLHLTFDVGFREALTAGRPVSEIRAGFTIGFPLQFFNPAARKP